MKRRLAIIAALAFLLLPVGNVAAAFNPLHRACGAGDSAQASSVCTVGGNKDPVSGSNGVLKKTSLIIATIAGIAAVIVIIIGGFQFVTSGGDPQKAANARSAVLGAVVGLVIIAAAEGIITFVLSKL